MTPQEKAKELVHKYYITINDDAPNCSISFNQCKQCALIAVDEINKAIDFDWMEVQNLESQHRFWEQVKKEIERL